MIQDYSCNHIRETIAVCFDFAINTLKIKPDIFVNIFINSKAINKIEIMHPGYFFGMSGIEICQNILDEANIKYDKSIEYESLDRNIYYWLGDSLAYYAFNKNYRYKYVFSFVSIESLLKMYDKYHEIDISYFVNKLDEYRKLSPSKLKNIRENRRLSQNDLSLYSMVSLRTIRAYEQKQKDINKAEVMTVLKLAHTLNCSIDDILEY